MESYPKSWLTAAFFAGILLTLGLKDLYPDLEARFRKSKYAALLVAPAPIRLEDHTAANPPAATPSPAVGAEALIGNTPLIAIPSLSAHTRCTILAKAEHLNGCGGSPKARVALAILRAAEADGKLTPHAGDVVYEGTVGSTGLALAALCAARGYGAHICMPADVAAEKAALVRAAGGVVERVPPAPIVDAAHYVNVARRRAAEHTADAGRRGRGFFADQFENGANWRAHYEGTAPEIWAQCGGALDAFVAGAGTGGTVAGVGLFLKERLSNAVRVVLADPEGSGLYNRVKYGVMFDGREREGTRRRQQVDSIVEGIGCNRVTHNFEVGREMIDDAIRVTDAQALAMARWLSEKDGLFVGGSSAVNCVAAVKTAMAMGPGHRIVTVLCDDGSRHLSRFWARASELDFNDDTKLEDALSK